MPESVWCDVCAKAGASTCSAQHLADAGGGKGCPGSVSLRMDEYLLVIDQVLDTVKLIE